MALDAFVDSIDTLPEGVRGEYMPVADGPHKGKFQLDVKPTNGYALGDIDGLRNSYAATKTDLEGKLTASLAETVAARAETATAQSALGGYKGLNLKPSEMAASLRELAELKKLDPENEADKRAGLKIEAFKTTANKDFEEKLTAETAKTAKYRSQVEGLVRTNAIQAAIGKADGIPELLTPAVSNRVKTVENADGTLAIRVLDAAGNAAQKWHENTMVDMNLDDLVAEFKAAPVYAGAFKASGRSGSGAPQNAHGAPAGAQTFTAKEWRDKVASEPDPVKRRELLQGLSAKKYIVNN